MQSSPPVQVTLLVKFLQTATQSNFLISALNTIATVTTYFNSTSYHRSIDVTQYVAKNSSILNDEVSTCALVNSIAPAGFYSASYNDTALYHKRWPVGLVNSGFQPNASAMVDGFFGGCTPLHALLESTLDCLANITCLEQFGNYFPALNQVSMRLKSLSREIVSHIDQIEMEKSSFAFFTEKEPLKKPSK